MAHADADIAAMVFRQAALKTSGVFSIDRRALSILMEFDGKRTVAQIARRLELETRSVYGTVRQLSALGLIEPVTDAAEVVGTEVIDSLSQHLARAVGPLAAVLVEEEILGLGYKPNMFPKVQLTDLINRLSAGIRKEDKRRAFLTAVAHLVQTQ